MGSQSGTTEPLITHAYTHTRTCTHTHAHTSTHTHIHAHTHMHTSTRTHTHAHTSVLFDEFHQIGPIDISEEYRLGNIKL